LGADSKVFVDVDFFGNKKRIALEIILKPTEEPDSSALSSSDLSKIIIESKKNPSLMSDAEKLAMGMEELIKNNPHIHPFSQYSTQRSLLDRVKFSLFNDAVLSLRETVRKNVWQHLSKPLSYQMESFIKQVFTSEFESMHRDEAAMFAAQINRLDILKLIMDTGPLSSSALSNLLMDAALKSQSDTIHYLCNLDVDFKSSACHAARQAFFKNDFAVLEILLSSGKVSSDYFGYLVLASVEKNSIKMLNFLLDKNSLSSEDLILAIQQAIKFENLPVLQLLVEKGFTDRNQSLQSENCQAKIVDCLYTAAEKKNQIYSII
jgi:hypothetical protein